MKWLVKWCGMAGIFGTRRGGLEPMFNMADHDAKIWLLSQHMPAPIFLNASPKIRHGLWGMNSVLVYEDDRNVPSEPDSILSVLNLRGTGIGNSACRLITAIAIHPEFHQIFYTQPGYIDLRDNPRITLTGVRYCKELSKYYVCMLSDVGIAGWNLRNDKLVMDSFPSLFTIALEKVSQHTTVDDLEQLEPKVPLEVYERIAAWVLPS